MCHFQQLSVRWIQSSKRMRPSMMNSSNPTRRSLMTAWSVPRLGQRHTLWRISRLLVQQNGSMTRLSIHIPRSLWLKHISMQTRWHPNHPTVVSRKLRCLIVASLHWLRNLLVTIPTTTITKYVVWHRNGSTTRVQGPTHTSSSSGMWQTYIGNPLLCTQVARQSMFWIQWDLILIWMEQGLSSVGCMMRWITTGSNRQEDCLIRAR